MLMLLFWVVFVAHAEAFDIVEMEEVKSALAETELQLCLSDEECEIDSSLLAYALQDQVESQNVGPIDDHSASCNEDKKKKKKKTNEEKKVETQLLLVSEIYTPQTENRSSQTHSFYRPAAQWGTHFQQMNLNPDLSWPIHDMMKAALQSGPNEQFRRSVFVEGLIQFAGQSKLGERELALQLKDAISAYAKNDAEKIQLLTTINDRLYWNYNEKRNPFQNKNEEPIARGNISLNSMMKAAAERNPNQGGVCNDISKAIAQVGEVLFPDRDVLVINNGLHFGVLIHDQNKGNTIINWDIQTDGTLQTSIDPKIPVGNTRIFQVKNGLMKEIAVIDTESGAVLKKLFNSPTATLQTGTPPSVVYAEFKREVEKRNKKKVESAQVALAETRSSQMLVVVGQMTHQDKRSESKVGVAVAQEKIKNSTQENIILAIHGAHQRKLIHFKSPTVQLIGSAGVEVDFYTADRIHNSQSSIDDLKGVSANIQTNQTVQFQTLPQHQNQPQLSGQIQVVQTLSSKNEGARQGAIANPDVKQALLSSMKYTGFQLNQVNAHLSLDAPLARKLSSVTEVQYQGSNIGQRLKITSGVQVVSSAGMKVYAFMGYVDHTIKGYRTRSSLFTQPSGGVVGGSIETKNGTRLSTDIQGVGRGSPVQGNVKAVVPLFNKNFRQKK